MHAPHVAQNDDIVLAAQEDNAVYDDVDLGLEPMELGADEVSEAFPQQQQQQEVPMDDADVPQQQEEVPMDDADVPQQQHQEVPINDAVDQVNDDAFPQQQHEDEGPGLAVTIPVSSPASPVRSSLFSADDDQEPAAASAPPPPKARKMTQAEFEEQYKVVDDFDIEAAIEREEQKKAEAAEQRKREREANRQKEQERLRKQGQQKQTKKKKKAKTGVQTEVQTEVRTVVANPEHGKNVPEHGNNVPFVPRESTPDLPVGVREGHRFNPVAIPESPRNDDNNNNNNVSAEPLAVLGVTSSGAKAGLPDDGVLENEVMKTAGFSDIWIQAVQNTDTSGLMDVLPAQPLITILEDTPLGQNSGFENTDTSGLRPGLEQDVLPAQPATPILLDSPWGDCISFDLDWNECLIAFTDNNNSNNSNNNDDNTLDCFENISGK